MKRIEAFKPVHGAPEWVEGVVQGGGQVVPVINLRLRFCLKKTRYALRSRLVVIDLEGRVVGIAVDTAREFTSLDAGQIQPPPDLISGTRAEYLEGVISRDDSLILVLDLRQVLTDEERAEFQA